MNYLAIIVTGHFPKKYREALSSYHMLSKLDWFRSS